MKKIILMGLLFLAIATGATAQQATGAAKQKSEVELFIRSVAKIKSPEIDYAYISFNTLRSLFAPLVEMIDCEETVEIFSSIKSMRRFSSTGSSGHKQLASVMEPFTSEEETVMGMEIMSYTRSDGLTSVIYCDDNSVLVVNDDGSSIVVVFVSGLSRNSLKKLIDGAFDVNFINLEFNQQ